MSETEDPAPSKEQVETGASEDVDENNLQQSADDPQPYKQPTNILEKKLAVGWVGRIFGDKDEKTGNIAVTAVFLAFVLIAVVIGFDDTETTTNFSSEGNVVETTVQKIPYVQVIVTGAISIITAALGYVFGVKKTKD